MNKYAYLTDISFLSSFSKEKAEYKKLFNENLFSDDSKWNNFILGKEIPGLLDAINARMKYFMSKMSLSVYNVLENGPAKNLVKDDEIYLFSGFTEIGTVSKIGDMIMENNYSINPSLFPNSVHHISLCYFTILKKLTNYCAAITDGILTNLSFVSFIKNRIKIEGDFVIVCGEEDASFFHYEEKKVLEIAPSFVAYKVKTNSSCGFSFFGTINNLDELKVLDIYKAAENIFCGKASFPELKNQGKSIFCEYPLVRDNPCGIAYRLAFPFYYDIKGRSLVIEKIFEKYHVFEVLI